MRPRTEPTTIPAIAPGDTPVEPAAAAEELFVEDAADLVLNSVELVEDEEGEGDAHPSFGAVGANPSIGCAKACASDVVATNGAIIVDPLSSYLRTVAVDDTVKSL